MRDSRTTTREDAPAGLEDASAAGAAASAPSERNWLLGALTAEEYAIVLPHFETVELTAGQRLGPAHEAIPYVYFPQYGVVSMVKRMRDGSEVEVGTIGYEGMTAVAVFLGGDVMPTSCVVQVGGAARRITARALQDVSGEGAPMRPILLCYTQYLFDQVAQSVACDRLHSLEQRCARWFLTTHDRLASDEFALTHEQLATLLGVRRAGVSVAAETLRKAGAITYMRGKVRVVDRERLLASACECYHTVREDFMRLLGRAGRVVPALAEAS